jgi:hypothetical protein
MYETNVVFYHPVALVLLSFVHRCKHRFKCNTYFRVSHISLQFVSTSLGHHQVSIILLKLLQCHLSMSRVNASLFLISSYNQQSYEVLKILKLKITMPSHAKY